MRVAEYDRYGGPDVLEVRERSAPEVQPGHVVVRVRAAALNPKDVLTRNGKYPWFAGRRFPKRVGYDWAGEAAQVGAGVTGIREGDALFGMIQAWSGGACAEYVHARVDELAPRPAGLSWTDAAALPLVSLTSLQALRDLAHVAQGARVLINGASGGVGVHAIQIAKALGAHVTTLTSAANQALVRGLGADDALDYATWNPATAPGGFDAVFDVFGNRRFAEVKRLLAARGTYVTTVPSPRVIAERFATAWTWPHARLVVVKSRRADLETVSAMVGRGALRAVVDRVWPLSEIADAQRYLATKRARGKIVVEP